MSCLHLGPKVNICDPRLAVGLLSPPVAHRLARPVSRYLSRLERLVNARTAPVCAGARPDQNGASLRLFHLSGCRSKLAYLSWGGGGGLEPGCRHLVPAAVWCHQRLGSARRGVVGCPPSPPPQSVAVSDIRRMLCCVCDAPLPPRRYCHSPRSSMWRNATN